MNEEIYNKALKYITIQDRTKKQITIYLKKNGYSDNDIGECIKKLADYNYINDRRYVFNIMIKKIKNKNYSIAMAENYLYSESIDESIIMEAINSLGEEYEENALYVFLKNELNHRKYDDQYINKIKNKALRKGFKYYSIQKMIDTILFANKENN